VPPLIDKSEIPFRCRSHTAQGDWKAGCARTLAEVGSGMSDQEQD